MMVAEPHESKTRLLDAALKIVREKGYHATRIEDMCSEAGVTKGSFFHHFRSKEDIAVAAVAHWDDITSGHFAEAPYHMLSDPLDRLLAYVDFRKELLVGDLPDFTCFAGTIIQEAYRSRPELVKACERNVSGHARSLEPDIAKAMQKYGIKGEWTAGSLALHTQAVIQGAFVLAKAKGGPEIAAQCLDHLKQYLALLFSGSPKE